MSTLTTTHKGGEWLITESTAEDILTPEGLSEEHRLIAQTAAEFVAKEVVPSLDELEKKNWTRARELVRRSGELGLLGVDVPEEYGGVALDKLASVVVGEAVGVAASFATTFGAQTGLSIIPILCFGNDAQKKKYLPRIVSGEIIGAYCLSESGAGSDALGARTRATKQPDGSWKLNGEKMWITNGGFADLYVVFAKVDGEHFSAFLVERGFPGVSNGNEEHKMGLHGSSTTPVVLNDAKVPAENLLGEVGRGHKIAFNVLNYGRFKLAAMSTGSARARIGEAATYASTRRQFGQPIASFGAIGNKLAEMSIRAFAVESALYRTAGLIDAAIGKAGHDPAVIAAALEEFAIESSLLKVAGSEMIDFVVDENVQIHGGNGFVRDYAAERHYRDSRVNRIFEGTNEINRLLVPGMLVKRGVKGGIALIPAAKRLQDELLTPAPVAETTDPFEQAGHTIESMKKAALMVIGLGMQTYGERLADEQEFLMLASDIIMETFLSESALLRARQTAGMAGAAALADRQKDAVLVIAHDAGLRVEALARTALGAMVSGDTLRTSLAALRRLHKIAPVNTVAVRRRISAAVLDRKGYPFTS